ncbi:hypothetical protein OKW29_000167 [Paraburkholderia sp. CI3]
MLAVQVTSLTKSFTVSTEWSVQVFPGERVSRPTKRRFSMNGFCRLSTFQAQAIVLVFVLSTST